LFFARARRHAVVEGADGLLKDGNTPIQFAKDNPKKVGSKAWDRYEQYKDATSIAQTTEKKAGWQDLTADFEKDSSRL